LGYDLPQNEKYKFIQSNSYDFEAISIETRDKLSQIDHFYQDEFIRMFVTRLTTSKKDRLQMFLRPYVQTTGRFVDYSNE